MKDNPSQQPVLEFKETVSKFIGQMQDIFLESNKILEIVEEKKKQHYPREQRGTNNQV